MKIEQKSVSKRSGRPIDISYTDIESEKDFEGKQIEGARAYCFYQDKLVIVHESKGHWSLPGGGIEDGEKVKSGIRREIKEETNMRTGKMRFVGLIEVKDVIEVSYYVFAACLVEPDGVFSADPSNEVTEIDLIDPSDCKNRLESHSDRMHERMLQRALELKSVMESEILHVS